jgi:beta-galactosidase GanA
VACLTIRKEELGGRHPDTLTAMNNLARLYNYEDKYEEAEPLFVACLAMRKEELGDRHPDTVDSMNRLVALYTKQGRLDDAKNVQ